MAHILDHEDMAAYHPSRNASAAGGAARPEHDARGRSGRQCAAVKGGEGRTGGEGARTPAEASGAAQAASPAPVEGVSIRSSAAAALRASGSRVRNAAAPSGGKAAHSPGRAAQDEAHAGIEDKGMRPNVRMALCTSGVRASAHPLGPGESDPPPPASASGSVLAEEQPLVEDGGVRSTAATARQAGSVRSHTAAPPTAPSLLCPGSSNERQWSEILARQDSEAESGALVDATCLDAQEEASHPEASVTPDCATGLALQESELRCQGTNIVRAPGDAGSEQGNTCHIPRSSRPGDGATEQQIIAEFLEQQG